MSVAARKLRKLFDKCYKSLSNCCTFDNFFKKSNGLITWTIHWLFSGESSAV